MQLEVAGVQLALQQSPRRRSIAIKVTGGQASVVAPRGTSLADIRAFVHSKLHWIQKHLQKQRAVAQTALPATLQAGEWVRFLGGQLQLEIAAAAKFSTQILEGRLVLQLPVRTLTPKSIRQAIKFAFTQAAQEYLATRVPYYAAQLGVSPRSVTVKEYKSRWGSCNSRREIQFNWLIMQAPCAAVDYVIAHELCHLVHFNHSPAFWALLQTLIPNYSHWRRWFKEQGASLHI